MERHRTSGRSNLGAALATCTMLLWAVLPLALQVVLERLDPVTITAFRFLAAAACLGGFLALRGQLPALQRLDGRGWLLLVCSTTFLAINYLAFLLGLAWTSAAHAQVLIQLAPLLLALGGIFVFRERFLPFQWASMAVLLLGLGLFFAGQLQTLAETAPDLLGGTALMLLAAVTWAVYGLAQKQLLTRLPSQAIMLCIYLGCSLLFVPAARPADLLGLDAVGAILLGFVAANTLLGYGTFSAALEHWEASRVSAVLAVTPLGTLAFAELGHALWPGEVVLEQLDPLAILGALLVVGGSLGISLGGRRVAALPEPRSS